jgi:hypothetical protein
LAVRTPSTIRGRQWSALSLLQSGAFNFEYPGFRKAYTLG